MNDESVNPNSRPPAEALDDPVYAAFGNHDFIILSVIVNRLARSASPFFRRNFGIGLVEWRIAHVLGIESPLSAHQISLRTDIDKGAISRSLKNLEKLGWIEIRKTGNSKPRKYIYLTPIGARNREIVSGLSAKRQEEILEGIDDKKLGEFRSILQHLIRRTGELEKFYSDQALLDR